MDQTANHITDTAGRIRPILQDRASQPGGLLPALHAIQDAIGLIPAEACQSMGAEQLLAHAERALGCRLHEKNADGSFSLDPVYCLGQCATAPAVVIDDAVHARVTPARFDRHCTRRR